jgi:hypothetical protein
VNGFLNYVNILHWSLASAHLFCPARYIASSAALQIIPRWQHCGNDFSSGRTPDQPYCIRGQTARTRSREQCSYLLRALTHYPQVKKLIARKVKRLLILDPDSEAHCRLDSKASHSLWWHTDVTSRSHVQVSETNRGEVQGASHINVWVISTAIIVTCSDIMPTERVDAAVTARGSLFDRTSWLTFSVVFLGPSRQVTGFYLG